MTDAGYSKGIICEHLHCTLSELSERCKEITDEPFIIEYYNRKHESDGGQLGDGQQ